MIEADRALAKIKSMRGVLGAYILDAGAQAKMVDSEAQIHCVEGMVYENRALNAARQKNLQICVFTQGFIEEPREILIELVDGAGHILGHDVPPALAHYNFPGAVWISDDFVVYPEPIPAEEPKLVLLPHRVNFLGPAEGVQGPIAF